jgi:hypothetical protein
MRYLLTILSFVVLTAQCYAQDTATRKKLPVYVISTNLVNDIESIPTIDFERFFTDRGRLKSWLIDFSYQIHYSDQFGVAAPHGDNISVGVYQGPAVKGGIDIYSRHRRRHWLNYYQPALGLKYLWYDDLRVNTGPTTVNQAYRIQSEKSFVTVPQFAVGAKHFSRSGFCADFFAGLQLPIKFRYKTVYYEQNGNGVENPNVPYKTANIDVLPAPVIGIKLGYMRTLKNGHKA